MSTNRYQQLINTLQNPETPLVFAIVVDFLIIAIVLFAIFMLIRGLFNFFEMAQVEYFKKKLFFNHVYIKKNKLSKEYKQVLSQEFSFYNRLNASGKLNFEHRLYYFLKHLDFIGKDIEVTNKMKVLIAATATKLTFGFRDYKIQSVNKIIIYPKKYYSTLNKQYHKGEFNLRLNALVFSWEDFLKGYAIEDDNLNLGVHEYIHALHFTFLKSRYKSTSAAIFIVAYQELTATLDANNTLKQKLITSGYFRAYAFENQFEFISVLIENFIETPEEFREQFPEIYIKVRQMLNFNFAGY